VSATAPSSASDNTLSPAQKVLAPLIDPAVFDFWAGMVNPAWSWSRALARVVDRRVEAQDTVTLVLQPNRHCSKVKPGQHVNVSAEVNGHRTTRSYSITNVPGRNGQLEITVKRVDGGKLSTQLCRHTQVGDALELGPAFGDMVLPAQPQGPWLFLAAGSGITPLVSLTRALAAQAMPIELTLIYWARTRAELCFVRELRLLAASQPRFKLHVVLTDEVDRLPDEEQGMINREQLARLVGDLSSQQVFACGPGGFVDAARELVAGSARSFKAEGFTASAAVALAPEAITTVRVQLLKSQRALDVSSGTSLLEALELQGLKPASGCRLGICHTCVCTKHSGTTQDTISGEQDTESDTTIRLCVSRACTDISLDL
jgi:ferredoxin-NADP reductase